MELIELQVCGLSNSESSPGHFVLVLEEAKTRKRMPIIIGAFEAQAIAIYMENLNPPRPLTHDLFASTLKNLEVKLQSIQIDTLPEGTYIAQMFWLQKDGSKYIADARCSDAIALAVRFDAPIMIPAGLFEKQAMSETIRTGILRGSLQEYSSEELDMILADFLEKEDYEGAARIRDILKKKKEG
jgi:hypothetical protein